MSATSLHPTTRRPTAPASTVVADRRWRPNFRFPDSPEEPHEKRADRAVDHLTCAVRGCGLGGDESTEDGGCKRYRPQHRSTERGRVSGDCVSAEEKIREDTGQRKD